MSTSDALNRIADALFTQAKSQRKQVEVAERHVQIAEYMLKAQEASMSVTRQLEKRLMGQVSDEEADRADLEAWIPKNKKPV